MSGIAIAEPFTAQPISREEALDVARKDAVRAYHDLSGDKVLAWLEDDGWHVDYELESPEVQGGGPHYVIDAFTGRARVP